MNGGKWYIRRVTGSLSDVANTHSDLPHNAGAVDLVLSHSSVAQLQNAASVTNGACREAISPSGTSIQGSATRQPPNDPAGRAGQ